MKRRSAIVLLLAVGLSGCQSVGPIRPQAQTPPWTVCFSPRGGCTQLIIDTLASAQSTILVQAYSFTSEPIAHNKVMVIDGEAVITGSFNFTKAAEERNAENLFVIRDQALAAKYDANWHLHEAHSQPY